MKLLYGSQNFGYDNENSDKDWVEFIYPTIDDIMDNNMTNKTKNNEDGSITKVKDIRLLFGMIEKANFNEMQLLYSQEMHDVEDLAWFFENRDALMRANIRSMFKSNWGFIQASLKRGQKKDLVRAEAFDNLILETMFGEGAIPFQDTRLRKYREERLFLRLQSEKFKDIALLAEKDEELLAQAKAEVERLVRAHLIKILVE